MTWDIQTWSETIYLCNVQTLATSLIFANLLLCLDFISFVFITGLHNSILFSPFIFFLFPLSYIVVDIRGVVLAFRLKV
jgi:hypothetical protein